MVLMKIPDEIRIQPEGLAQITAPRNREASGPR